MKNLIKSTIETFNAEWVKCNGDTDFGTCGFATVDLSFGRKIKFRKWMQEQEIIYTDYSTRYGKKVFSVITPKLDSDVRTQNIDYYQGKARAICNALNENYGEEFTAYVHAYVD